MPDRQNIVITLQVRDDYGERTIEGALGETLLVTLQDANVGVGSVCGGQMACGTCQVFLEPLEAGAEELPQPRAEETALLEYSRHYRPGESRLACQVEITPALRRARIVVAPDE